MDTNTRTLRFHPDVLVAEHGALLEQLEAERYTHSSETLAEVKRRIARERPETPHQILVRKRHELAAEQARQLLRLNELRNN